MIYNFENYSLEFIHSIENEEYDIEFYLYYQNKKYFGWAFTIKGVEQNMLKNQTTGEEAFGSYFWATDFFIIKEMTLGCLRKTIDDIILNSPHSLNTIFSDITKKEYSNDFKNS